jgi:hypothetical protein
MQQVYGAARIHCGLSFAADGEIVGALQKMSQTLSDHRVIIDYQDAPNAARLGRAQVIFAHESTPRATNAARTATMPVRVLSLSSSIASKRAAGCGAQQ